MTHPTQNEADADFSGDTTDTIISYVERTAPTVAGLDEDAALYQQLKPELDAALAELKARLASETNSDTALDVFLDQMYGEDYDHYLRHVTSDEVTFKARHTRRITTDVMDGQIVHEVIESYSTDANNESLASKANFYTECPACGADIEESTEMMNDAAWEADSEEESMKINSFVCPDCPFMFREISLSYPTGDGMRSERPVAVRVRVPRDAVEDKSEMWEEKFDFGEPDGDNSDKTDYANVMRVLELREFTGFATDKAYDSDESAIQTETCNNCGVTVDAPATSMHPALGTVCPDCKDIQVWSAEDAEIPEDVRDRMDTHKSFTVGRLRRLLRDAIHFPAYQYKLALARYEERENHIHKTSGKKPELGDTVKTGEQGVRTVDGSGSPGTGMRRPGGAFHNVAHWRTVLGDAVDTGLIERVDGDDDVEDDEPTATWRVTEKGRGVFAEIAKCEDCGGDLEAFHKMTRGGGRYGNNKSDSLVLVCPECEGDTSSGNAAMTISSSTGQTSYEELPNHDVEA